MRKCLFLFLTGAFFTVAGYAQSSDSIKQITDSVTMHKLGDIVIKAYSENRELLETAAPVNVVDQATLAQYNNTNILAAVNTTPGVRMEERSPDSYRFGIRGSSLESPFGVRNVKVYYNDIPYTDPGGNTYLNQLGFYNIQSLEIVKGPGSSLYGAGTGGVLLINSMPTQFQNGVTVNYTGGSYGLSSAEAEAKIGDSSFHNVISFQQFSSDGYRQQSSTKKEVASWDAVMKHSEKSELSVHFFYGDLYYQTPGGLTLQEYNATPTLARPTTPAGTGAIDSKAAIYQKTFLAGFTYTQHFNKYWSNSTTLYGDYSQQYNPNLRNYSRTSEPNFGGRTSFTCKADIGLTTLQWTTGAEAQQGLTDDRTYNNINGNPQNIQTDQEINTRQLLGFTQLSWQVKSWIFTAGASLDQLNVDLNTLSTSPYVSQNRTFNNQAAPRIAVLDMLTKSWSVYGTVEKGFSPPTIAELAPTGSEVNLSLNPEQGWNYEVGTRGYAIHQNLYFDVSVFYFSLTDAIVQRVDSLGGDHYVNAGSTVQEGLEAYLNYKLFQNGGGLTHSWNIYASYTGYHFNYDHFVQLQNDYSGKQLPGVAPNTIAAGTALEFKYGFYLNINYFYSAKMAMNDANSQYSTAYNLLSGKVGYRMQRKKYEITLFADIDNALNEKYSLGNDINAINGRYYNAAAGVNYFGGVSVGYK